MGVLVGFLRRLREMTDEHAGKFSAEGFRRFFAMLAEELGEAYFEQIESALESLQFKGGVLMSAQLGAGNKGEGYNLRRPREQSLFQRVFDRSGLTFTIPDRDENGFRALGELQDRGTNLVANSVQQSVEHVLRFFVTLCVEIGFYVACVNLSERLADKGEPICFPVAVPAGEPALSGRGLYDVCLTLTIEQRIVSNELNADRKTLVMITGANQGGKSTLLRSLGLAHLMMQSGMFVGAQSFRASICADVFTHYKREEDATMHSGQLDEELARMSEIAGQITPNSILLCNESFASTNEREGSEIARQVVRAMLDKQIRVFFVTHMYDLAHGFHVQGLDMALFLRAERQQPEGRRTFKLAEGEPLPTSYGEDSYLRIFGAGEATGTALADTGR
jgi:DNA mismatch repair ATPase MutS